MSSFLRKLKQKYIAMRGFHTGEQLLVIESDDWGSIRMPSRETYLKLQESGDNPEADAFLSNDSLETEQELENLFATLRSVKDSAGKPAIITANFAMANPDFDTTDYTSNRYCYEPFYKTYERFENRKNNLNIIKKAYEEGLFLPQLHCREHLNVKRWMHDLQNLKEDTVLAFKERTFGIGRSFSENNIFGYMDAFNCDSEEDAVDLVEILEDAVNMFEKTFGYYSETFVASCFVWADKLEKQFARLGIRGIQCAAWQNVPTYNNGTLQMRRKLHFTGEKGRFGQMFSVRNCSYEPAYKQNPTQCRKNCFKEIENAFRQRKPAIINSHRFNYINSINPTNAEINLLELRNLLEDVVEAFPNTKFISSVDMLNIMKG